MTDTELRSRQSSRGGLRTWPIMVRLIHKAQRFADLKLWRCLYLCEWWTDGVRAWWIAQTPDFRSAPTGLFREMAAILLKFDSVAHRGRKTLKERVQKFKINVNIRYVMYSGQCYPSIQKSKLYGHNYIFTFQICDSRYFIPSLGV